MFERVLFFIIFIFFPLSAFAEEGKSIVPYVEDRKVCGEIEESVKFGKEILFSKTIKNRRKNVFVGKNIREYNSTDYYLWVIPFDFSNDGHEDLLAIDWLQRNKDLYYLAMYGFLGAGEIYEDRSKLKEYFLNKKILTRHGEGAVPLVSDQFIIKNRKGELSDESFVGFHKIEPISIGGKIYILAERDGSREPNYLIFQWSEEISGLQLICKL